MTDSTITIHHSPNCARVADHSVECDCIAQVEKELEQCLAVLVGPSFTEAGLDRVVAVLVRVVARRRGGFTHSAVSEIISSLARGMR